MGGPVADLQTHLPLLFELIFSRSVDNFLNYVPELLAQLFEIKPDMLRSDERNISFNEVLDYPNREELISAITGRKVMTLSSKGLTELSDDLSRKHGLDLFEDARERARAAVLVEKRNLVTHNRGLVNRRFQERAGSAGWQLGEKLTFPPDALLSDVTFLLDCVRRIDQRAQVKFGIPASVAPATAG